MQSDSLDNKIREAADHHHPAYDENAWKKMEKLLDEHLPPKKDNKRRFIFFLFLFLFVGGGAWLLIGKPWSSSERSIVQNEQNKLPGQSTSIPSNKLSKTNKTNTVDVTTQVQSKKEGNKETIVQQNKAGHFSPLPEQNKNIGVIKNQLNTVVKNNIATTNIDQPNKNAVNNRTDIVSNVPDKSTAINSSLPGKNQNNNNSDINKPVIDNSLIQSTNKDITKDNQLQKSAIDAGNKTTDEKKSDDKGVVAITLTESKTKNRGKNKKNNNSLSFSVSAGPDISKARNSSTGRVTLSYGAGVNYTHNRFSLRSGFYVAKKIYSANPNDYSLPYILPSTIKLVNVDANCSVFEIPLDLTYAFGQKQNSNWYAGLGLSSYLMTKENYTYWYKSSTSGQVYPRNDVANNVNKHYFSVLNLMTGYTRQLSKKISISAEPYLKIPLTGIGVGKVHLNSGGILFTIGIKPFEKRDGKK
ncbi:MAG TPA: hypothetical protein VET23_09125 [Chitinophagaceae bacterium]|nr:hypothetical protein [Chitinophagaceae bacterium]